MDVLNFLVENAELILVALLAVLAVAGAIVKLTPTKTDDAVVAAMVRGANFVLDLVRARKVAKAASSAVSKVTGTARR